MINEFCQGIDQFNQEDFYGCHDTLEALWMEAMEPQKRFYQGILQIAVGCYHLGNLNCRGAAILLGEGIRQIKDYQPVYESIDVSGLITQSLNLLKMVQQLESEKITDFVQVLKTAPIDYMNETCNEKIGRFPKIMRVDAGC
ncbi:MAG TPA: DUF309 domain-containing protein [Cyanobacteria bacterium UBA11149]|nr:DUF309 domain-containing protein [Cyanobacteria bacterium UBA11367]HBE57387.1 DUF309 domain-containing protein [Cyanobacteria bacterium UBA11366]HBK65269.1 DUF309 domain-containing protein [Cyanobacteria bacterium UBA11166]HBR75545.1 DUF309 domain-containing protein [Cyanobacteria bacterium UBA11159]HBS69382.1 DUF309 domain-containing protein [Cyanobacteria bacterium UBA11153]HBW89388.1 DUF309 domain-containing protein [Cyanobacteria bacterium UBA11149]HCA93527.1 DUF309 domain-containing p